MNNTLGKLVTVEGIEGVGKSSNVQFIAELIRHKGNEVVVTREPGGTPIAEDIRKILLQEYSEVTLPETELLLLYAGRLQHVEHLIKPALQQGKWVVCDRFVDATFAYQGAGRGMQSDKIDILNQWVLGSFTPNYTIVLDAPVEIAFSRIKQNRKLDRFEKERETFFEKVRQEYLHRAALNSERYYLIDASQPLSLVQEALTYIISQL